MAIMAPNASLCARGCIGMFEKGTALSDQILGSLGTMAGGIAHDFNNILAIIDGYTRMLERHLPVQHAARYKLDAMRFAVRRGTVLTHQLLTYTRQKNHAAAPVHDVFGVLHDNLALLQACAARPVSITADAAPADYPVRMGADDLIVVTLELIKSADKNAPHGGTIRIHVTRNADTGTVIMSFCGLRPSAKSQTHMNFGLERVHGIIRDHGGTVSCDKKAPHDTCVSVLLPAATTAQGDACDTHANKNLTVLVVDDERDMTVILGDMLSQMGHTPLLCTSGNDALALQDDHDGPIDVVLSDIVMPDMDGFHFATLFSSVRPQTRIIHMTGHAGHARMPHTTTNDAPIVLNKPVKPSTLTQALRTVTQHIRHGQGGST